MLLNGLNRISIYKRIQLSFILFIFLPSVIATLVSYASVKDGVMRKIQTSNANVVNLISDQLNQMVDNISFAAVYFSDLKDRDTLDSLRALGESDRFEDYATYQHYNRINGLASIMMVQAQATDLRLFLLNPQYRLIAGNLPQPVFAGFVDETFRRSIRLNPDNALTLQWFPIGEYDSPSYYYYAARVIADPVNHEHLATLFIGIPRSYFAKLFDIPHSGTITLTDRSGTVIARSGKADLRPADGGKTIRSETVIPKVGWSLAYETPHAEATGQITKEFLVSVSIVGSCFVVFILFSVYLARGINTPIVRLRNTAKEYVRGNRQVRMPVSGKDEMAQLANVFNRMLDDINRLIEQVETEQEEKRAIELEALYSQIRPHFLLNTLNSIKVRLILSGDTEHSRTIESLISLLRAYVRSHEPATLAEECKLLGNYVTIMQVRSQLRVDFRYRLTEEAANCRIPRLLLQPIVENAVIHGFALHPPDARIELEAAAEDGRLVVRISDNGRGMPEDKLNDLNAKLSLQASEEPSSNRGVGLINIARRLKLGYGASAGIRAGRSADGGMSFVIRIPCEAIQEEQNV
jgi:two-component system sensor histidine kinase YesM